MYKYGKTYKIIVCGKKATGKTSLLEQLIYNNNTSTNTNSTSSSITLGGSNQQLRPSSGSPPSPAAPIDKYFPTIEDIYVACWEKDKGIREKLRFYDTRGMESARDSDTINQMRHLFPLAEGAILVFSSLDSDSIECIQKLKSEIDKSKEKKEICHFVVIDNWTISGTPTSSIEASNNREAIREEIRSRLRCPVFELSSLEKSRDVLCRPFVELVTNITQIPTKSSMNLPSIKKGKAFLSKNN